MTSGFGSLIGHDNSDVAPLRGKWGWIVALGAVYVIAGLLALGSVVLATVASVFIVGVMMMIAGVAEVIGAFQFKSWGRFVLWILLGALYVAAGVFTLQNPLFAAVALTLALGIALLVSGVTRLVLAFGMPRGSAWGMVLLSGVITILVGLVILARWPVSSVYTLGIFLGIDLIFAGAGWLALGWALRSGTGMTNIGGRGDIGLTKAS